MISCKPTDKILNTIKLMLGIQIEYDAFDTEIAVGINTALATLTQLGVGPTDGFYISTGNEIWSSFLEGAEDLMAAQSFIYMTVKLAFDPPTSSFVLDSFKNQLAELTSRLNMQVETP